MSSDWSPSGFLLTGRIAIVTGCARDLGRCLAHGLAAAGAQVLACDLVGDGANAVAKDIQAAGGKAHAFPMDVTNGRAALDAVAFGAKEFGSVDVLVNNAAIDIIEPVRYRTLRLLPVRPFCFYRNPNNWPNVDPRRIPTAR